jgi:hypothetical protein
MNDANVDAADEPIESYLDRVLLALSGSARHVRHTLAEVEAHLRDSAHRLCSEGYDDTTAERIAVERMGSEHGVTAGPGLRSWLTRSRRRRVVLGSLFVGGVAGLSLGAASVIAGVVRFVAGDRSIATPFPTGSYSAADCTRWMRMYPHAPDCVTAMTIDHADDFLRNCVVAGLFGLVALVSFAWLRRRWSSIEVERSLPRCTEEIAGAVLAVIAAVVLVAQGTDAVIVTRGSGSGQSFSLAAGAALAAGFLAIRARRRLARPLLSSAVQ